MKQVMALLTLFFILGFGVAQNVGIGTTAPTGKLQVNHRSLDQTGLLLLDSSTNGSGSLEFKNVNNTRRILMQGFAASNTNNGQFLDIKSDSAFIASFQGNGRIGVNNPSPGYTLDVDGDINTTKALRANGSAGTNGQVLRSNGNGTMAWDEMCQYNNFVTLRSITAATWTVPAGVTKIMVEVWGAGGGGCVLAGGGAGGYIKAHFTVTPGAVVNYSTGDGGAGALAATATNGTNSVCTVGSVTLTVAGGQGALYLSATNGQGGTGGGFSISSGSFINYMGLIGGSGKSQERSFFPYNATTYYESGKAGRGGDAPNYPDSGGAGQYYLYNTTGSTLIYRNGNPSTGLVPGGGGASGVQYGITSIGGGSGGDGIIVIHY